MVKNKPVHILVIRLSAMGDVAMTVPVLLGCLKKYPDIKITVLTKPFFAPIFSALPNVTVLAADVKGKHKGILGLWKLYKELRLRKIDMVADLHNVLRSTVLKQFFKIDGLPFIQIDKGRAAKKRLIDPNRSSFQPLKTTHQRYADVFDGLGYPISKAEMLTMTKRSLPDTLRDLYGTDNKVIIGVAPFAAFEGKMYPLHLMKEVIKKLNNTDRYKIILFGGGKKERDVLTAWEGQFKNVLSSAGKFSFSDELGLISNLELMLAMDSGNAHLAAMYGVPTLTLWGVTHPYAGFYPFGQPKGNCLMADRARYPLIPTSVYGNKFPAGYGNVMETIEPDSIIKKISEILDNAI